MAKFTPEQWYQALCDVHVMIFEGRGIGAIWWNGNRLEVGTDKSNLGKMIWAMNIKPRPTYEQALAITCSI